MGRKRVLLGLCLSLFGMAEAVRAEPAIIVNGAALDEPTLQQLAQAGVNLPAGRYWYDAESGAWGLQGQPASGFTYAGMLLGGKLQRNASAGSSRVFINGRELPQAEIAALRQYGLNPSPGRYWLDAAGNAGREGEGPVVNLFQAARSQQAAQGAWSRGKSVFSTYDLTGATVIGQ